MKANRSIVWFKNDLRLHDNEALVSAIQNSNEVIPLFILDPRWSVHTIHGFRKTGNLRMRFIYENAKALQTKLRSIGSDLYIIEGMPEKILPELIIRYKVSDVYTKSEFAYDEQQIVKKVEKLTGMFRVGYHSFDTHSALGTDFRNSLNNHIVFSEFYTNAIANLEVRHICEMPSKINTPTLNEATDLQVFEKLVDVNAPFNIEGGEDAALQLINSYLENSKKLENFKSNDENSLAERSFISPYLSQGVLSSAYLLDKLLRHQKNNPNNVGAKRFINDLLWREFYFGMFLKFGRKFFKQGGIHNKELTCMPDFEALNKWIKADTGIEIIDASMKELGTTGVLDKKLRSLTANYLSKQLLVDWRLGAAYFESQLLDYDVCINYGNWSRFVGVGTDAKEDPKFDTEQFAYLYDSKGEYRKTWIR
jgi:deoxyribodipyrimidine photo-lyase